MPRTRAIKKKPAGAYHHGNLHEAIVLAGTKIVSEEGPLELTVRRIALQLGVSHAAVYHHFEDRSAILAGVAEAAFLRLGEAIAERQQTLGATPLERLAASGLAYAKFALSHPRLYGVMFGPEAAERNASPSVDLAATRVFELLSNSIVECQKEGLVLPGTPAEHALVCWSAMHGFASLMVERQVAKLHLPSEDPDRLAEMMVLRIFTGLAPNPAFG